MEGKIKTFEDLGSCPRHVPRWCLCLHSAELSLVQAHAFPSKGNVGQTWRAWGKPGASGSIILSGLWAMLPGWQLLPWKALLSRLITQRVRDYIAVGIN